MKKILSFLLSACIISSFVSVSVFASHFDNTSVIVQIDIDEDVTYNSGFKTEIDFVCKNEIMSKTLTRIEIADKDPSNIAVYRYFSFFCYRNITRAEVSAVISRYDCNRSSIESELFSNSTCEYFTDVADGQFYTPSVKWAYENGIINGVGNNCFDPYGTCTREQFITMLYRYTKYTKSNPKTYPDILHRYTDGNDVSEWARDAMNWARWESIIKGKSDMLLDPQGNITRAEVATILYRYDFCGYSYKG